MEIETYTLPTYWAVCLYYGDVGGLDESDVAALNAWWADTFGNAKPSYVDFESDAGFTKYHDAAGYGVLAAECSNFIFHVER